MCRCCFSMPNGRQYTINLEPVRGFRYDDSDENFCSMRQAKGNKSKRQKQIRDQIDLVVFFVTNPIESYTIAKKLIETNIFILFLLSFDRTFKTKF